MSISRLQHLREPDRHTHRCSGAPCHVSFGFFSGFLDKIGSVGDNPEGPLKTGGIMPKTCKKRKQNTPLN
jgi:hypothetical protein